MLLQVMLPDAFYFVTGWLALLAREDGRLGSALQCTEVHFASFLSGGFITAIVVNPPERKLAKNTSVQWMFFFKPQHVF